eukprot:m.35507 g.35507  ORF g.35507 m.35507 type:complete len:79 (+) comp9599_c0_seq1:3948-4184(+)
MVQSRAPRRALLLSRTTVGVMAITLMATSIRTKSCRGESFGLLPVFVTFERACVLFVRCVPSLVSILECACACAWGCV